MEEKEDFVEWKELWEKEIEESFRETFHVEFHDYSPENIKRCKPFEVMNQKFVNLRLKYSTSFDAMFKNMKQNVFRHEYAKGGQSLHRGFYSPSAQDMVVSGCNRGKLLKRQPKNNNYDYEYLFDKNDKLICSKTYSDFFGPFEVVEIELFEYKPDNVFSFYFNTKWDNILIGITECQYENGVLTEYATAKFYFYESSSCDEMEVERFFYENNLMKSFCHYIYTPSLPLLTQNKYVFTRDEEGYFSRYTIYPINDLSPEQNIEQETESYHVLGTKRK